jgi:hypothetical protein
MSNLDTLNNLPPGALGAQRGHDRGVLSRAEGFRRPAEPLANVDSQQTGPLDIHAEEAAPDGSRYRRTVCAEVMTLSRSEVPRRPLPLQVRRDAYTLHAAFPVDAACPVGQRLVDVDADHLPMLACSASSAPIAGAGADLHRPVTGLDVEGFDFPAGRHRPRLVRGRPVRGIVGVDLARKLLHGHGHQCGHWAGHVVRHRIAP